MRPGGEDGATSPPTTKIAGRILSSAVAQFEDPRSNIGGVHTESDRAEGGVPLGGEIEFDAELELLAAEATALVPETVS